MIIIQSLFQPFLVVRVFSFLPFPPRTAKFYTFIKISNLMHETLNLTIYTQINHIAKPKFSCTIKYTQNAQFIAVLHQCLQKIKAPKKIQKKTHLLVNKGEPAGFLFFLCHRRRNRRLGPLPAARCLGRTLRVSSVSLFACTSHHTN